MFVGHYAASLAAKAAEPRAPLWTYVAAAQLMDIGWSALVLAGVEKLSLNPALPGSPLVLFYMPFTHSLLGALVLSALGFAAARWLLRLPLEAAALIGAVVFSHWLLDLLVHRPDLELWPHGPKAGLALWNRAVPEATLEMALVAVAGAAWVGVRAERTRALWPALAFIAFLGALQLVAELLPASHAPKGFAINALAVYLVAIGVAWAVDRDRGALRAFR